ncbi:hypothetical protein SEVIR_1G237381v4 [Setaria viridis]
MPNGNMDTWLHHQGDGRTPECLGLSQRINTAINIADALAYLHHDTGRPIVHCDLKPSNILLDVHINAWVILASQGYILIQGLDQLAIQAQSVQRVQKEL